MTTSTKQDRLFLQGRPPVQPQIWLHQHKCMSTKTNLWIRRELPCMLLPAPKINGMLKSVQMWTKKTVTVYEIRGFPNTNRRTTTKHRTSINHNLDWIMGKDESRISRLALARLRWWARLLGKLRGLSKSQSSMSDPAVNLTACKRLSTVVRWKFFSNSLAAAQLSVMNTKIRASSVPVWIRRRW